MALTTIAEIKSTWLAVDGNEHDVRLAALLAQAVSRMNAIANQPLDGTLYNYPLLARSGPATIHRGQWLELPFTVPVQYVSAVAKQNYDDTAYAAVTGITAYNDGAMTQLYRAEGFGNYLSLIITLTIGYDGTMYPVPADLSNIACEIVANEFRLTDYAGGASRIGLAAVVQQEAGTSSTMRLKDMDDVWRARLRPYTRIQS